MSGYAIKVIWTNGEEELLKKWPTNRPARFSSIKKAVEQANFMLMGMDAEEYQSINVVPWRE